MRQLIFILAFFAGLTLPVSAETYPARPITWVVASAPGGVADTSARIVARALSERLGHPVIIENKPGAAGIVGTEYVAQAKPDGYTILSASIGPMAINPSLYKGRLKYDPLRSFTPVRAMAESRMLLLINPNKPFKTLPELVAYAKRHPGRVNYGSAGSGTAPHLAVELLKSAADIDITHVPYKAGATEIADLLSGVIDFAIDFPAVVKPHIEAGKLIAIGMTGSKRLANYPDVPTIVELGYPDAQSLSWSTVVLPANASEKVVMTLSNAMRDALNSPAVSEYFVSNDSAMMIDIGPENMRNFIASEIERYRGIIDRAQISLE